jgi:nitrogenase-associated protein
MAKIVFYEKPGCAANLRQKRLLTEAGHVVLPRNVLTEPWTAERLREFFGARPVAQWFNRNAPRVKSGEVVPETLDADSATVQLLSDPLLIRRPLLEVGDQREVGFDTARIHRWVGLGAAAQSEISDVCAHSQPCPEPAVPSSIG